MEGPPEIVYLITLAVVFAEVFIAIGIFIAWWIDDRN